MRTIKSVPVILLLLVFFNVLSLPLASATTELGDGIVDISTSVSKSITVNTTKTQLDDTWAIKFDFEQRNTTYTDYVVQYALIDNNTVFELIPDVVIQPLKIRSTSTSEDLGDATLKVYKISEAPDYGSGYVYVSMTFVMNVNQTWQRSIVSDATRYLYDPLDTSPTYDGYNDIGQYYGEYSGSKYYFSCGVDENHTLTTFTNEHGIGIAPSSVLGSNSPANTTAILSQKEFYNEYAITEESALSYRRINVTRDGVGNFTSKLTNSSVYIINEDYELELQTSSTNANTSHAFDNVPVAIWIVAEGMESDATDRFILVYNDLGVDTFANVKGYTYDAETGLVLSSVSVESGTFSDTSDGTGYYHIGPVVAENEYNISASKSGYATNTFSVYLPRQANYSIDIPLIPDAPSYTGTAILGIVDTLPYHNPYENATVYVSNATWNTSVSTNNVGYYVVDELLNDSSYWINVSEIGYRHNNVSVTVVNGTYVQHDVHLDPSLSVEVRARNLDTSAVITSFVATMNNTSYNVSSGVVSFTNLTYGVHDLIVSSSGFYPYQAQIYVDSDMSHLAYLQISGEGVYYPQHHVALRAVNWYGRGIPGVNVSVIGGTADMANLTGDDGVAGFLMMQNLYYNITLTHGTDTKSISLMPVYNEYTIFFVFTDQTPPQATENWYDFVNFTVATNEINSSYAYINLTFVDAGNGSSNLFMFVNDSSDVNLNNSSGNISVVVDKSMGSSFFVGFRCDYEGYDDPLSVKKVVVFPWNLGEDSAFTTYTKTIMGIAFLILLGALFGTITVPYGGIVLPMFALILNWAGWFTIVNDTTTKTVCVTALVLAIMLYMRARESEGF